MIQGHDRPGVDRVVVWGTCDTGKPRVRILLQGLRENGVEVLECHWNPWQAIQDKSQVGPLRWLNILLHIALAYPILLWRYMRLPRHDWILLGYPGILDIFVIRLFAWLRGVPVAMDWFLSAYDTIALDRKLVGKRHPLAVLAFGLEWLAARLADCAFMDTAAHARRMERIFGLTEGRCGHVWVGVEAKVFSHDVVVPSTPRAGAMKILFYGQFIPLHGVPTIVEAAQLLRDQEVDWLFVGRGQESRRVRAMLDANPLPRLTWLEWMEYSALVASIAEADVCLGIFGSSDKAASVIPNKVFQVVAAGKPVITQDSPAIRELLVASAPCAYLVPAADPKALADAVLDLASRLTRPAQSCHADLVDAMDEAAIGKQLTTLLASKPRQGTER